MRTNDLPDPTDRGKPRPLSGQKVTSGFVGLKIWVSAVFFMFTKDFLSVGHGLLFRDSLSVWFAMAGKLAYILLRTDVYLSFPSSNFPVWNVFFFTKIKPSNEIPDDPNECKRKTIESASKSFLTHELGQQHVHEKDHPLQVDLGQKWAFGGLRAWAVKDPWRWKG